MRKKGYNELAATSTRPNENGTFVVGSSRAGSVYTTVNFFERIFGPPHMTYVDSKVTKSWFFVTPRGFCEVFDYVGQQPLSIGAVDRRAAIWAAAAFRRQGLNAISLHWHEEAVRRLNECLRSA